MALDFEWEKKINFFIYRDEMSYFSYFIIKKLKESNKNYDFFEKKLK